MFKWIIRAALLGAILTGVGYYYVDREVQSQLGMRKAGALPAIYSDMLTIDAQRKITVDRLTTQLLNRRYRTVTGKPTVPGEFSVNGDSINLISREFRAPDGAIHPAMNVVYTSTTGEIASLTAPGARSFSLEPQMVAPLGSGELRATNFKSLAQIPRIMRDAVIAIEDQRFKKHFGIDLLGIGRAVVENVRAMRIVQGGSTLTQQLAKNILFTPERTLGRKIKEALAAISLERHLTKDQILEMYLNEVYLGQEGAVSIHGVAEAASTFFGKKLEEITISEAALLAGMIRAPSSYSPRKHLTRALKRRDVVLDTMAELKVITAAQKEQAKHAKIKIIKDALHHRTAAFFVAALQRELDQQFNFNAALLNGLSIYTGLHGEMQRCAEEAVDRGVEQLEKNYGTLRRHKPPLQVALVALEPFSGRVKAWVGGRDFSLNQFDRVNQGKRQVGSTIKPFLYLTALDRNLNSYKVATTTTILPDRPLQVDLQTRNTWEPENYDHEYYGDVTLRFALENSRNTPAAYLGQRVGIDNVVHTIKSFRIMADPPPVPALALGAADSSLLDVTAAYGAIANGGIYVAPRLFLSALDGENNMLASSPIVEERVADENAVFVLTNILQGVVERGTGHGVRAAGFTRQVAGKTGTSNDARDAWFVGFTPDLVAGVWVGFDDNSKMGLTGGAAAVPIWTDFMKCVAPFDEELPFIPPPGVLFLDVDPSTGMRVGPECPNSQSVREIFVRGTEPQSLCMPEPTPVPENYEDTESYDPEREYREERPRRRKRSFWDSVFGE